MRIEDTPAFTLRTRQSAVRDQFNFRGHQKLPLDLVDKLPGKGLLIFVAAVLAALHDQLQRIAAPFLVSRQVNLKLETKTVNGGNNAIDA